MCMPGRVHSALQQRYHALSQVNARMFERAEVDLVNQVCPPGRFSVEQWQKFRERIING